jgi:nucleotide-binding universal stress UspA family protein
MIHIDRILCPVDFSAVSLVALDRAVRLARWYGATLQILHVTLPADQVASSATGSVMFPAAEREELLQQLREFAGLIDPGPDRADFVATTGEPVNGILETARAGMPDLLVIGTHGHTGFRRRVLGSVSDRVMRAAPCPVMIVPPQAPASGTSETVPFERILCAVDFSHASIRAVELALVLAQEAQAKVTLLHVTNALPDRPGIADIAAAAFQEVDAARARLRDLVPEEATAWCDTDEVVAIGRPAQQILQLAEKLNADLVVMGAEGSDAPRDFLFGSTTAEVTLNASCPVLTARGSYGTSTPSTTELASASKH